MSTEFFAKAIFYFLIVVVPGAFAYQMVVAKNDCEAAVFTYTQQIKPFSPMQQEKAAELKMNAACGTYGAFGKVLSPRN